MRSRRRERRGLLDVLQDHDAEFDKAHSLQHRADVKREEQELASSLQAEVVEHLRRHGRLEEGADAIRSEIRSLVPELLQKRGTSLSPSYTARIIRQIVDEITGYGPLEPLLADPEITEIMVNNYKTVFIERGGRTERANVRFEDEEHVKHVIERIVAPLGRRIDESSPMVDARLPDGSRVNAMLRPLAIDGPNITIRKFPDRRLTHEDLLAYGSATPEMISFLRACIVAKMNILVSGGTGSGKTTLLNILSNFIPKEERIVTIEDSAELRLSHMEGGNIIRTESRPPNLEGKGAIAIRDLVRNSLRQTPDRIIIGECRGGEAYDMLQAMNTGHEGSMTTVHANSPQDAVSRLEMLVLQGAPELPHHVVRHNIGQTIDIIVQQSRMQDGSRKIVSITEVTNASRDNKKVNVRELFRFEQQGIDDEGNVVGRFVSSGQRPRFLGRLRAMGIEIDDSIFAGGELG